MQTKLLETELALDEALLKVSAEKNRRRTLHNVLVVRKILIIDIYVLFPTRKHFGDVCILNKDFYYCTLFQYIAICKVPLISSSQ